MDSNDQATGPRERARFLVDASTAIDWGAQVPTGIPRLEVAAVWEALEHYPDTVDLFCYDDSIKRCRFISEGERAFLRKCMKVKGALSLDRADGRSLMTRLRDVFSLYDVGMMRRRETHRAIAQFLSRSRKRKGVRYGLTKMAVRIFAVTARSFRGRPPATDDPLMQRGTVCLTAISLCPRLVQTYRSGAKATLCIVQYDAVPFDVPQYCSVKPEKYEPAFRFSIDRASVIVSISHHTESRVRYWAQRYGIQLETKQFTVVTPASSALDANVEAVTDPPALGRFIVYCSTIEPRKNHMVLLQAAKLLLAQRGADVPLLVFAGKWGWKYEPVADFLDANPEVKDHVRVMPMVSDDLLAWLYRHALFSVFPSFEEGWGLAASESLEAGTPVLISDVGALREATQSLMPTFDPGHPEIWAEAIAHYSGDAEALAELRNLVREKYKPRSNRQVFAEMLDLMRSALISQPAKLPFSVES
jgi:glycosyltransferase involved in cell wall biosynthesis